MHVYRLAILAAVLMATPARAENVVLFIGGVVCNERSQILSVLERATKGDTPEQAITTVNQAAGKKSVCRFVIKPEVFIASPAEFVRLGVAKVHIYKLTRRTGDPPQWTGDFVPVPSEDV